MKNILRKIFLLTSVGWMCGLPSWSQTTKIEAESFIDSKSGSTDIKIENDRSVGYFDEYGEQLIYEINVETTGMYKMTFKYVSQTDGKIRISMDDGSYFVYNLTAYRLLGDNWWQLPFSDWYEFPIDNGPSFYLTQGKHIMTVTNEEAVFNLDCFMMQKSSVTDNEVAQVKTTPSKVVLMQGEYGDVYPRAYNKSGEMIAAPVTWSSNVKNGRYTAGSYGTDEIVLTMGSISKTIKVDIAKPTKKKEFVVSKYGSLRTDKGYVADASGNKVCLMGPSLFWSCSAPLWWNKETVNFLVEKYNIQVIRLPVAIAPCGSSGQTSCGNPPDTWNKDCYYYRPDYTKKLVDEVVKAAIENDIYVVIDFHEHKAEDWTNLAKEFFTYFATKWGEFPNVMYEIYNEPLYEVDNSIVISYAKQVIPVIRAIDKDNIIIVGSKRFSREPDQVTSAGDGYSNIAYTWHGYVKYDH
ncbi:MAG: cellulase family glycosylhydrolase [Paludibacteraceae bacterium]|nr:cellulase family glycosylhydrolase [Paludibacteraceae bacterium]